LIVILFSNNFPAAFLKLGKVFYPSKSFSKTQLAEK